MSDGQAERRFPRWTIAFLMVVMAVSLHMSGGAVADRGAVVDPAILSGFQELRSYVQNAPGQTLPRGLKTSLMRKLDSAEAAYLRGQAAPSEWTQVKKGDVTDLALHPTDLSRLYVGIFDPAAQAASFYRSKPGSAPSGEASWDQLAGGLPAKFTTLKFDISASQPDVLYVGLHTPPEPGIDPIPTYYRLYRSTNGGDTWELRLIQPSPWPVTTRTWSSAALRTMAPSSTTTRPSGRRFAATTGGTWP